MWPPSYSDIYDSRSEKLEDLRVRRPSIKKGLKAYYKDNPIAFINDWVDTYDPRVKPPFRPFCLFPRQESFIYFIQDCLRTQSNGLVEKSRDIGATWLSCAFAVWLWLFTPAVSVGFGSRKGMLVDRLGDPDSIFEKLRMILYRLPHDLLPAKFDKRFHSLHLKIINPENGSTITGEAGDNIGRGGRKTVMFKDESAHYEHPELIEAALSDTTNCQIDLSSVKPNTVFERKRLSGEIWEKGKYIPPDVIKVFIFDWSDHPNKTQAWYDKRRKQAERSGLYHLFAQEVDRDYSAALENIVIKPAWVRAAVDAHIKLGFEDTGAKFAGLDIADEGNDKNAFAYRKGSIIKHVSEWGQGDTSETATRAIALMRKYRITEIQYDTIGVGAGVKGETNRLQREGKFKDLKFIGWAASKSPLFKKRRLIKGDVKSPLIGDFFRNLKAQAWWELRNRFEKTFKAVNKGVEYPFEELVSIDSKIKGLQTFLSQLSLATYSLDSVGRIIIDKKGEGGRSPNIADACTMAFTPLREKKVVII